MSGEVVLPPEPWRDRLARWLFARMISQDYRVEIALGFCGEIQEECLAVSGVHVIYDGETEEASDVV